MPVHRYAAILLAALAVVITDVPAAAHHGAAAFDTNRDLTLTGTVTEWIWANPHCFLKFDARDDTGMVRNWAVETQNPTDMSRRGWRRSSFKVGDTVTVVLEAVKNGSPVGRVKTLPTDPDPRWYGYSVGRWEDDNTLFVETIGMDERTWLDNAGNPHSDQLKVEERYHRVNMTTLELTVTIDDPKVYTAGRRATSCP